MSTNRDTLEDLDENTAASLLLVSLPHLGPARLRWLLDEAAPVEVVAALRDGRLPAVSARAPAGVTKPMIRSWTSGVREMSMSELTARNTADRTHILTPGDGLWPFAHDPEPPALLFARGDLDVLRAPVMVAIVGTRQCTTVGRQVATDLGAELAEAGVVVVSGLAAGIDACAHRGALAGGGRPLAVVGTGLDVVYPAANRRLWARVADAGLLASEAPAGTPPDRWRFPARNRLIAALADVVVVVESHRTGGSMHTVHEAAERGRLVMAVPGSVTSAASEGTNQLLSEGCPPVRGAADVLDALGFSVDASSIDQRRTATPSAAASIPAVAPTTPATRLAELVLDEASTGPVHMDTLVARAEAELAEAPKSFGGQAFDGPMVHHLLAEVADLVARGIVALDGATVSLRQQPPL